jgi:hypothetical protein
LQLATINNNCSAKVVIFTKIRIYDYTD